MALGATHYRWRPDVRRTVDRALGRGWPISANTYINHPWPGWDGRSVDFWGPRGRGDPINLHVGHELLTWLWNLPGEPWIRHYIYLHTLWTSFGGRSRWNPNDHSGALRHVHVTYW